MLDQAGAEPNLLHQNREAVTEDRRLRQSDHEKTLRAILASPEAKQAQDVLDKAEAALEAYSAAQTAYQKALIEWAYARAKNLDRVVPPYESQPERGLFQVVNPAFAQYTYEPPPYFRENILNNILAAANLYSDNPSRFKITDIVES